MQKKNKNTAEVLVECLEAHGVTHIFGVPGEENLAFLEAIRKSRIKFITTRHEQAAAFMAATFGRITGKLGVAMSTLGPGAANLITGVAYAQLGGMPLLVITGQKPIKKSKQGKFQIVDVVAMMKPVTKFSATIGKSEDLQSLTEKAITLALTERRGAVHLELPEDIAEEICKSDTIPSVKMEYTAADKNKIEEAIRIIENSKHPIVILGRGAGSVENKELISFFNKTKMPFITTQMGKGAHDENSELYIGTTALSKGDFVHQALEYADAIILIGHDVIEKPPVIFAEGSRKNIIHVNLFPSVAKDVYVPTFDVIGGIAKTISEFTEKIKANSGWDFSYFFQVRDALKKDISKHSESADFPLRPERIVADLNKVLPRGGALALDNGMYKLWIARNFLAKALNSVLLDNTLATMGAGLPSGMALKIIDQDRKVIVVAGDGGIMMSLGDLETAVRLKIDLVVLVLDDAGYGMIRWKQKDMNLPDFALSFNNPDFVKLAESFGAIGHKVVKADDLEIILRKSLGSKGVHVIACPINYEEANKYLGKIQ